MKHDVVVELAGGKQIKFETGRIAKQASGAAFTTSGDNAVLATAVASPDPKEGIDFFPLTVEYREFTYAGGRIPGGFIKRAGRLLCALGREGKRSGRPRHQRRKRRSGPLRYSLPRPRGRGAYRLYRRA